MADPFQTTLSGGGTSTIKRAWFEHGDAANQTVALWVSRWPATGTFTPLIRTVTLQVAESLDLRGYDTLSGAELALNQTRSGTTITLNGLSIPDYPILLKTSPRTGTSGAEFVDDTFPSTMVPGSLRLATVLSTNSRISTGGVNEGYNGNAKFLGKLHILNSFAVSFRICTAKVAFNLLLYVLALSLANN